MEYNGFVKKGSKTISNVQPLVKRSIPISHIPFFVMYAVLGTYVTFYDFEFLTILIPLEIYRRMIPMIVIVLAHILVLLICYWTVWIRVKLEYRNVDEISKAEFLFIQAHEHKGKPEIVKLLKNDGKIKFYYQRRKYEWLKEEGMFKKPSTFPILQPISNFKEMKGLETHADLRNRVEDYGENRFDMPIPTFLELFKEHALAPFFVFQIFCVGLWMLDEYWYYSLFTLVMLFAFESTVVNQRLRNMKQVRQMAIKSIQVHVFRKKKWIEVSSEKLVPGDIVSLLKMKDGFVCPCDVLLRSGKCVTNEALLTGESTPQIKESIDEHDDDTELLNMKKRDKRHIVFGGTRILQHHRGTSSDSHLCPPDGGAVGIVLKTGFETSQGKLVRTILFTTEHVSANNTEALFFILFLLIFAILASAYVLYRGLKDPKQSRYKLMLNCIMIITSVVPPELPMELSLAVNTSLMRLHKLSIFCTQPFRIPFAGTINVCCFDKTGTLTSDKMNLMGVTDSISHELKDGKTTDSRAKMVLGACHSLINMDGQIVGDPMEKAGLLGTESAFRGNNVKAGTNVVTIVKRFAFSSEVKRMSVIVSHKGRYLCLVKGAPEMIKEMIETLPEGYDETVSKLTAEGHRVIALASKVWKPTVNMNKPTQYKLINRSEVESKLEFNGFAAFDCGVKPNTLETMKELVSSDHKVMMITGDNPLTACHVGRQLHFTDPKKEMLILKKVDGGLQWVHENHQDQSVEIKEPIDKYCYCVTGRALATCDENWRKKWIPKVQIFARTTPSQKEVIINTLKSLNYGTLMCGDGCNDVGALKAAAVGVALLDSKPSKNPKTPPAGNQKKPNPQSLSEVMNQMDTDEQAVVQLGDASIASPFTSKIGTIQSVYHIIRQGRCTLATTMQMYKILALNCLISAYSLSVLYLDGVKYGDNQLVLSGIAVALCFLFVSRSNPLEKLSKELPKNSLFNIQFFTSLLGQFFIHIVVLVLSIQAAKVAQPPSDYDKDIENLFKPNLVNTVVFILTTYQTVVTFLVNYQGHPFMQSLTENRGLFICLLILGGVCVLSASNLVPELNEGMELVLMPNDIFRNFFVVMILGDVVVCLLLEKLTNILFG